MRGRRPTVLMCWPNDRDVFRRRNRCNCRAISISSVGPFFGPSIVDKEESCVEGVVFARF